MRKPTARDIEELIRRIEEADEQGLTPCLAYRRVSSRDQERGYSLEAQDSLLTDYSAAEGMAIVGWYEDAETGKRVGRRALGRMLRDFEALAGQVRHILVEKTDRIYRNLRDYVTFDELMTEQGLHLHLVKERDVLHAGSGSHAMLFHGIKVLMAKNYVDNLSEEVVKGNASKASSGRWPSKAFLGYVSVRDDEGRVTLAPDPDRAGLVRRLFELYAQGLSFADLREWAKTVGLRSPGSRRPLGQTSIERLIDRPRYHGFFEWNGRVYRATYPALITPELWEACQERRRDKPGKTTAHQRRSFLFAKLVRCRADGGMISWELKKKKHILGACLHRKKKPRGAAARCEQDYIREADLEAALVGELEKITLHPEQLEAMRLALHDVHRRRAATRDAERKRHEGEERRLVTSLDTLYLDLREGLVDAEQFRRLSSQWHGELADVRAAAERLGQACREFDDQAFYALDLAGGASRAYLRGDREQRASFCRWLLESMTWADGRLEIRVREPFAELAATARALSGGPRPEFAPEEMAGSEGRSANLLDLGAWLSRQHQVPAQLVPLARRAA